MYNVFVVEMKKQSQSQVTPENGWPNPDDIIKEYLENTESVSNAEELCSPAWYRPLELHDYSMLPPSMWPITPESLADTSTLSEWG